MKTQTLFSRNSPLDAPVKVVRQTFSAHQGKPARRLSFVSGLHGDEMEGLYLCHRLIQALRRIKDTRPEEFLGEVHVYPAANPPALNHGTRLWPFYGSDMNRMMGPHPGKFFNDSDLRQLFQGMMHLLVEQGVLASLPEKIPPLPASRVVYPREVAMG